MCVVSPDGRPCLDLATVAEDLGLGHLVQDFLFATDAASQLPGLGCTLQHFELRLQQASRTIRKALNLAMAQKQCFRSSMANQIAVLANC